MKHDKSLFCFVFKLETKEIVRFPVNYTVRIPRVTCDSSEPILVF